MVGEQAVAQLDRGPSRGDAELAPEGLVEPLELPEGGVAVAVGRVALHQRDVGRLVAGVELDQLVPAAVEAQQVEVAQAQLLTTLLGPLVVAILRQQLAAVEGERAAGRDDVLVHEGAAGQLLELHDVDRRRRARQEHDVVAPQHDRVGHREGAPGVVRGLVQLGHGLVQGVLGPDQVDELLAVEAPIGREREDLDQRRGVAPRPAGLGHRHGVHRHREVAEHRDLDRRHRPSCSCRHVGPRGSGPVAATG